jgi:hypothetical protein
MAPAHIQRARPNMQIGSKMLAYPFTQEYGYIIGYAVVSDPNTTCATAYIPAGGLDDQAAYVYDHFRFAACVGKDSVEVSYAGLANCSPAANGNWVGIWQGCENPYSGAGPLLARTENSSSTSSGKILIPGKPVSPWSVHGAPILWPRAAPQSQPSKGSVLFQAAGPTNRSANTGGERRRAGHYVGAAVSA